MCVCALVFFYFFFSFWIDGSVEKEVVQTALRGGTRSCVGGERALNLQSNLSTRHAKKKREKKIDFVSSLASVYFILCLVWAVETTQSTSRGKNSDTFFFFYVLFVKVLVYSFFFIIFACVW